MVGGGGDGWLWWWMIGWCRLRAARGDVKRAMGAWEGGREGGGV